MISKWLLLFIMGLIMLFYAIYIFQNPFIFRYILGCIGAIILSIGLFVYIYKEISKELLW